MGTLNDDSICFRCQRLADRNIEGFGKLSGCTSAASLGDHARVFECSVTVTECERFKEIEEVEDAERQN